MRRAAFPLLFLGAGNGPRNRRRALAAVTTPFRQIMLCLDREFHVRLGSRSQLGGPRLREHRLETSLQSAHRFSRRECQRSDCRSLVGLGVAKGAVGNGSLSPSSHIGNLGRKTKIQGRRRTSSTPTLRHCSANGLWLSPITVPNLELRSSESPKKKPDKSSRRMAVGSFCSTFRSC